MIKKKIKNCIIWVLPTFIIIAVFVLSFFLLRGTTKNTGSHPDPQSNISLTCNAENIFYPFFSYDNSDKKTAKITIIFQNNQINSIALTYALYYNDVQQISSSETLNHAALNHNLSSDGFSADSFNAVFSKLQDRMQLQIYAADSDVNNHSLKYFFIEDENTIFDMETLKQNYQKLGFFCK